MIELDELIRENVQGRTIDKVYYEELNQAVKKMLEDIDTTLRKQKIDLNKNYNFDLVNFYSNNNFLSIEIFFIRDGLLFGRHNEIIPIISTNNNIDSRIILNKDII